MRNKSYYRHQAKRSIKRKTDILKKCWFKEKFRGPHPSVVKEGNKYKQQIVEVEVDLDL